MGEIHGLISISVLFSHGYIYNSPVDANADGRIMYIQFFSHAILVAVRKYGVLLLKDAIH